MKKLSIGILVIILGIIVGNNLFLKLRETMEKDNIYYFLQEGVYKNESAIDSLKRTIPTSITEYKDKKYYVYLGITKNKNIANKLKNIFKENNLETYIKEKHISNEEVSETISQYDLLISKTKDNEEIMTIEEVVISNYEEILKD